MFEIYWTSGFIYFYQAAKRLRTELKKRMELERITSLKPLLKELENGQLPFMCLQFKDDEAVQQFIPAVYLGVVTSLSGSEVKDVVSFTNKYDLFNFLVSIE